MKYLMLFVFIFVGCSNYVPKADYIKLADSIQVLNIQQAKYIEQSKVLHDSVNYLKQWTIMTNSQRLNLKKYDRLYSFFKICEKDATQWGNYKGWSTRIFRE